MSSLFHPIQRTTLRAASAAAITGSTTLTHADLGSASGAPVISTRFKKAVIQVVSTDQNLPNGANQIDVYFQTTYDEGTNWVDIEAIQYLDASAATGFNDNETAKYIVTIQDKMSAESSVNMTDAGLSSPGRNDLPLGDGLRVKVVFANTTGSPSITFGIEVLLYA